MEIFETWYLDRIRRIEARDAYAARRMTVAIESEETGRDIDIRMVACFTIDDTMPSGHNLTRVL